MKKILLGLGTFATIEVPLVAVASCSCSSTKKSNQNVVNDVKSYFSGAI